MLCISQPSVTDGCLLFPLKGMKLSQLPCTGQCKRSMSKCTAIDSLYSYKNIKGNVLLIVLNSVISGSLSPWHGASPGCGWRNGLQYGGQLQRYWIRSHGQPTRGGLPAWRSGEVQTTCQHKNLPRYEPFTNALDLDWPLIWWIQWKRDLRFSTWNMRSLYRPRSLTTMVRQLAKYQLDLVGVQEVR